MPHDPNLRTPRKARRSADYADIVEVNPRALNLLGLPSSKLLIGFAARHWGVAEGLLASESRDRLVAVARHHAMWLLRTHRRCSLSQIGRLLGDRDHTTVINGIAKHIARMEGRVPLPFVWSPARIDSVARFARTGAVLHDIRRHFSVSTVDLYRHPGFRQIKAFAEVEHGYRKMEAARRRQAGDGGRHA